MAQPRTPTFVEPNTMLPVWLAWPLKGKGSQLTSANSVGSCKQSLSKEDPEDTTLMHEPLSLFVAIEKADISWRDLILGL